MFHWLLCKALSERKGESTVEKKASCDLRIWVEGRRQVFSGSPCSKSSGEERPESRGDAWDFQIFRRGGQSNHDGFCVPPRRGKLLNNLKRKFRQNVYEPFMRVIRGSPLLTYGEFDMRTVAIRNQKADYANQKDSHWFLDSGASRHMCRNLTRFQSMDKVEDYSVQTAAADTTVACLGIGSVDLRVNRKTKVTLTRTLYIPEMQYNLISVTALTDGGYQVEFDKDRAYIKTKEGEIILTARQSDGVYTFREYTRRRLSLRGEEKKWAGVSKQRQVKKRASGRPKLVRSGGRGRPRKIYRYQPDAEKHYILMVTTKDMMEEKK